MIIQRRLKIPSFQRLKFTTTPDKPRNMTERLPKATDKEELQEYEHFCDVLDSFRFYEQFMNRKMEKKKNDFHFLLKPYQNIAQDFIPNLGVLRNLISKNQTFLNKVADNASRYFCVELARKFSDEQFFEKRRAKVPSEYNMDKVVSTLKQCVRDWSDEGFSERESCYGVVLKELVRCYPDFEKRKEMKVLSPGCGLGRLTWEIARKGFFSQGNEFSYFMLFVSHFILNFSKKNANAIFPHVNKFKNNLSFEDQVRSFAFPNVDSSVLPDMNNFSMVAGDFVEIYSNSQEMQTWDAVVSVFFLDTARNVFQFLELISRILKPGGVFINFGPLLYHFADIPNDFSVEFSLEDIKKRLPELGLRLVKEEINLPSTYCDNPLSMQATVFKSALWVCEKVGDPKWPKEETFPSDKRFQERLHRGGLRKLPPYIRD